ncbi:MULTISPECIES: T9SS type A sorting domain-containing protein [Flavobacterium]|uniref:Secretion system C-terminal sorting domain-containing protein n=1 Tax=Flavobacterium hankyongi TaxID=1176532 RepID=A0ABP8ZPY6_9FLAO|nr:T9SS type A sorting domain-containing protein [Flavobacterium sp. N1846]
MKKLFCLITFLLSLFCYSQQDKISFTYDNAGNQIKREYCPSCPAKTNNIVKEVSEIVEQDLLKFYPEDEISYYPNPVKELLFLKWDVSDSKKVRAINIYSLNGQLIKAYNNLESKNEFVIQFQELPQNVYSINLSYTDGDNKSIKIIKE